MKNIIKTGLLCALTLAVGASAHARGGDRDKALAALGGFIGGVITSEALHDHHRGDRHAVSFEYRGDRDWRGHDRGKGIGHGHGRDRDYDRGHGYGNRDRQGHGHRDACSCGGGHWKFVERRVWVPGSFGVKISSCGTRIRYREPGYFKVVKQRVWVSGHSHGCRYR